MSKARSVRPTQSRRSITGAISELIAAAHFAERGYNVFRCVAPTSPFDLVLNRGSEMLRVEVKTATLAATAKSPNFSIPTNDQWDLLAVVYEGKVCELRPGSSAYETRNEFRAWAGFEPVPERGLPTCSVDGCERGGSDGLCSVHRRMRRLKVERQAVNSVTSGGDAT